MLIHVNPSSKSLTDLMQFLSLPVYLCQKFCSFCCVLPQAHPLLLGVLQLACGEVFFPKYVLWFVPLILKCLLDFFGMSCLRSPFMRLKFLLPVFPHVLRLWTMKDYEGQCVSCNCDDVKCLLSSGSSLTHESHVHFLMLDQTQQRFIKIPRFRQRLVLVDLHKEEQKHMKHTEFPLKFSDWNFPSVIFRLGLFIFSRLRLALLLWQVKSSNILCFPISER